MFERKSFKNGFEYIEIKNSVASAKIALQGAHLFEYKRHSESDLLWLSEVSDFEYGKAIRGGIPICWPRFGVLDKSMPAHGFARTARFELIEVRELSSSKTEVRLLLKESKESRAIWNYAFELELLFLISEDLEISLKSTNRDREPFMITEALHSYFMVSDISDVTIEGFESIEYIDMLKNIRAFEATPVKINEEIDRVYTQKSEKILLKDSSRELQIRARGSNSTVLWNPWIEKGSKMSGMKKDAYREFVCIESANAFDDFVMLESGESHSLDLYLKSL